MVNTITVSKSSEITAREQQNCHFQKVSSFLTMQLEALFLSHENTKLFGECYIINEHFINEKLIE